MESKKKLVLFTSLFNCQGHPFYPAPQGRVTFDYFHTYITDSMEFIHNTGRNTIGNMLKQMRRNCHLLFHSLVDGQVIDSILNVVRTLSLGCINIQPKAHQKMRSYFRFLREATVIGIELHVFYFNNCHTITLLTANYTRASNCLRKRKSFSKYRRKSRI